MKITLRIVFVLLALYLPAAHAEESTTTQTLKLHADYCEYTFFLTENATDPYLMSFNLQYTWGESFYGGPVAHMKLDWCHPYYEHPAGPAVDFGAGGVLGFNVGNLEKVAIHFALILCAEYKPSEKHEKFGGFFLLNIGPSFNLGGGWRLSVEADYLIAALGLGLGVSCSF
jgi:hypothetical protein